jgi:TolC family type I secretion outer membrane protein
MARLRAVAVYGTFLTSVLVSAGSAIGAELTLEDALGAAYMTSPRLEAQRAQLRSTDEDVARAVSGYRPQIEASGSYGFEHNSVGSILLPAPNGHPRDVAVTITQPVFDGRTLLQIRLANAAVRAGRAQLTAVEQSVLLDAATAYFDVVQDQAGLEFKRQNVALLQQQLGAVRARFMAGDLTDTDVQQVMARIAGAQADVATAEARLSASRAAFERTVGRPAATLQTEPRLAEMLPNEQAAVEQAEERNPQIITARQQAQVADISIDVASSERLPTLSLQAQYLRGKDQIAKGVNEEALSLIAQLRVPIYQGGAEYADLRKARELRDQAVDQIESTLRDVRDAVHTAWAGELAARNSLALYEQQVRADQAAYDDLQQQVVAGERTVIELLNAAQELLAAQVSLVNARHDYYVNAYRVSSAIGRMTATALNLPVAIYDPEQHYNRDAYSGLPRVRD